MDNPTENESKTDVIIVGAGPAGLMATNWFARLGVRTRIVDKRGTKVFKGHADGIQCRTLEILDSFDLARRIWQESNPLRETNVWNPDINGLLCRSSKHLLNNSSSNWGQPTVLHQGRIERFFLDSISNHSDIAVERGILPEKLDFDESLAGDENAYPIKLRLRHLSKEEMESSHCATADMKAESGCPVRTNLDEDDAEDLFKNSKINRKTGHVEHVSCKYLIGCDGAHSWVRSQLGFSMRGESTDFIWGVIDMIAPITDFPDIRMPCTVHSANCGSLLIIPRENKIVRLYIQLIATDSLDSKVEKSKVNPKVILSCAQRILHPYKITYRECDWWSVYQIGQRVCEKFSLHDRIFLAGDAVHTHSPKVGQGMNVSLQDT